MGKEIWCRWLRKVSLQFFRYLLALDTLQDGNEFVSHHFARGPTSLNDFSEAMLCDFTSGVSVVSVANLVNRGFVPPPIRESPLDPLLEKY